MEFNEKNIKQRLAKKLSELYTVEQDCKMELNYNGEIKILKPDLICKVSDSVFFVVEVKDDSKQNFKLTNLLRQCAFYRFSNINGIMPVFVAFATYKTLFEGKCYKTSPEMNFANKLQIGVLRTSNSKSELTGKKGLEIIIGSQIVLVNTEMNEYSLIQNTPSAMIGTTASTNKMQHKGIKQILETIYKF